MKIGENDLDMMMNVLEEKVAINKGPVRGY